MNEKWRDIAGYEGIYQVSSLGHVKRIARGQGTYLGLVLRPNYRTNGYTSVELWKNAKNKRVSVHRLVASAFVPNPNNFPIVNHLNSIRDDNRSENLEWANQSMNNLHAAKKHGAYRGEKNGRSILTREQVMKIRAMDGDGIGPTEIGKQFGITKCHAWLVTHRRIWKHI